VARVFGILAGSPRLIRPALTFARSVLASFNGFELLMITGPRHREEGWNRDYPQSVEPAGTVARRGRRG
jgi:hypothetical protein